MSHSDSFESACDDNDFKEPESNESNESSDDEPLVKRQKKKSPKKASPKKSKSKKLKKSKSSKKDKKEKSSPVKPISVALVKGKTEKVEEEYEVEAIVGHREYNGKLVYKIRWKGYEAIHDTWESHESLSCPDILEMYNIKHKVNIPNKKSSPKKRKSTSNGKSPSKKRRSSLSDEEDEDENDDFEDSGSASGSGDGDPNEEYEVDRIMEMRTKRDGSREFLVHWKRWSSRYDTWEPENNLNCPDIIEKFEKKVDDAKNTSVKELRTERKHTKRFTLATRDSGRRLSKRNTNKQRVSYFDAEEEA